VEDLHKQVPLVQAEPEEIQDLLEQAEQLAQIVVLLEQIQVEAVALATQLTQVHQDLEVLEL
jgi:hypothetical protein